MSIHVSKRLISTVVPAVLLVFVLGLMPVTAEEQDQWSFGTPSFMLAEADEGQEEGEEEPREYDYILNKLSVLWELATTYVEARRFKKAIETYEKIIHFEIPEGVDQDLRNDLEFDRVHIYMSIADLYMDMLNDFDTAMVYLEKGVAQLEQMEQEIPAAKDLKVEMYKMIAGIYRSRGEFDQAIEWLNKALEVE